MDLFGSVRRDHLHNTLSVLSTLRLLTAWVLIWFGSFDNLLNTSWLMLVISDCTLHLVSGMITTLTFTLMVACSQKCPEMLSATHYSTLATFEVFGKLCMVSVSGSLVDILGYLRFFIICTILMLLPLILLGTRDISCPRKKEELKIF